MSAVCALLVIGAAVTLWASSSSLIFAATTVGDGAAAAAVVNADESIAQRWDAGVRAGAFIGAMPGTGLEAGFAPSHAWQAALVLMTGQTDLKRQVGDGDGVALDHFVATGRLAMAQARYFLGETFYLAAGLGWRQLGFVMRLASAGAGAEGGDNSSDHTAITAQSDSAVAAVAVGNQWSWDNGLFIGADWIGVTIPFASRYRSSVATNGPVTEQSDRLQHLVQTSARTLGTTPAAQLLVIDVGVRF